MLLNPDADIVFPGMGDINILVWLLCPLYVCSGVPLGTSNIFMFSAVKPLPPNTLKNTVKFPSGLTSSGFSPKSISVSVGLGSLTGLSVGLGKTYFAVFCKPAIDPVVISNLVETILPLPSYTCVLFSKYPAVSVSVGLNRLVVVM